jgi:hypothetical protein
MSIENIVVPSNLASRYDLSLSVVTLVPKLEMVNG